MANSRPQSLKKKRDFEDLREKGRVLHVSHWLLLAFQSNDLGVLRVGWTLPKYVGNAVTRNRLRRWGREQIKNWDTNQWRHTLDVNFVFKRKPAGFYRELSREEFKIVFNKAWQKLA